MTEETPSYTWGFVEVLRTIYTSTTLFHIFGVGEKQQRRFSLNPKIYDDASPNPFDRIESLLEKLMSDRHNYLARAIVSRFARIVGCELFNVKPFDVPKNTNIEKECLKSYGPIFEFHQALYLRNKSGAEIETLRQKALDCLNKPFQIYIESLE